MPDSWLFEIYPAVSSHGVKQSLLRRAYEEAMTTERSGATTYRTSRLQRGLALVAAASLLLLAGLQATGDRPSSVVSYVDFALMAVGLLVAIGYGFKPRFESLSRQYGKRDRFGKIAQSGSATFSACTCRRPRRDSGSTRVRTLPSRRCRSSGLRS
jgi:hypothetical protein